MGILVTGGVYSVRALRRMDAEREEYEEALQEYRLVHGLSPEEEEEDGDDSSGSSGSGVGKVLFHGGTVAFDLGTVNLRVGHLPSSTSSSPSSTPTPTVVVDWEGGRSTLNCIVLDAVVDSPDGSSPHLVGNIAASKRFDSMAGGDYPVLYPALETVQFPFGGVVRESREDVGVEQGILMSSSVKIYELLLDEG